MSVPPGGLAGDDGAQGAAVAVTKAVCVVIAAVGDTAMGVPTGGLAALHSAQGPAVVVAVAALVGIAAVSDAAVSVPPGSGAALYRADGDGFGRGGPAAAAAAVMMPVPMGGDRQGQQYGQSQKTKKGPLNPHDEKPPTSIF